MPSEPVLTTRFQQVVVNMLYQLALAAYQEEDMHQHGTQQFSDGMDAHPQSA